MFHMKSDRGNAGRGRWPAALLALALPLAFAACEDTLNVEQRDVLTPEGVSVDLLVAGADRDFTEAYAGGESVLSVTALMTDEFFSAGTFPTRTRTDARNQFGISQGNTSDGTYIQLQQARRGAIRAFDALTEAGEGSSPDAAEMKLYEAFTYIALGENYCSNIPFSEPGEGGSIGEEGHGQPLSTDQIFEASLPIFDQALSIDPSLMGAAVGKARALLNLNRPQEAAAAVAGVPTDYMFLLEHSDNTGDQENGIFNLQSNGRYSLSEVEGQNGIDFRSAGDPRVPWVEDPTGGFEEGIPLYITQKYSTRSTPIVLAGGVEARLIEAEAALAAGDAAGMISILNDLRSQVNSIMTARVPNYGDLVPGPNNSTTTLSPLSDPGTPEGRVDLLFRERAFWMHVTGHRLGDMRRLVRQYGRSASEVYPVGDYHKPEQATYDNDVVLPLAFEEVNNVNWSVDMCNVDQV